ncbi:MAG: hypothetical protein K0S22_2485 [Oscillospiraceae bacterium]|nr:hypothetical protein [Oscillospiraceae bacterium]
METVGTKFERHLIEQCAPTLAAIKVGNLFHCTLGPGDCIDDIIYNWNNCFLSKEVQICLIKETKTGALVYVFRPTMLSNLLARRDVIKFLKDCGFSCCHNLEDYIEMLSRHICDSSCFPHEIGIFLGYPLRDVQGFIENKGKDFCLCSFWKVYTEPQHAQKLFAQYRKCFCVYKTLFENGRSILQLTVAA